ncbi:hypothetical protein CTEN210_15637 [Chaetoceros tenuissimus]|uniref:Kri1-like C-terminal domain-containing protein n=1 Tax=Chaetoceros tenuissimus TaxID=426638 RepID=A0AAD3HDF3_9STRA|nr:hypothetical protein CTEN210_15637 [Chaetoceros tenuissimus]
MSDKEKKKVLEFSDSESDSENESNNFKINKKYATEYDKRKRRQELINAKQNDEDFSDDESSSDESEDEGAELLTDKVDLQILKTINAIRNKDESIYSKDKKFFEEKDSDDEVEATKKYKPMKYRDVVREKILEKMENGEDARESDDDDSVDRENIRSLQKDEKLEKLAYDDEQKELRSAFMTGDDDESSDSDDDWLVKKKGATTFDGEVDKERINAIEQLEKTAETDGLKLSDPKGEVQDGDKFLLDFIKNKRWVDQNELDSDSDNDEPMKPRIIDNEDDGHDSDASLQELDKTDDFESKYNFRFEEANENSGAALSVVGYSRTALSDTVRRKDESRKLKRQQRKERKEAERKAKEERLKRLKNAKKEELEDRIKQIKAVVGDKVDEAAVEKTDDDNIDEEMVAKLMEGDFDPDKFEDIMSKMYSDDFYAQEEKEWKTDLDVKESLKKANEEDGIVLNEEGEGDVYDDAGGEMEYEGEYDETEDYDGEEDLDADAQDKDVSEKESSLDKKLKERMLDELYKLDYEDIIGDMPTRFKYRKVEENRYGLTPEEILFSRDTSLKQFVSLKRMAPYIEDGEYNPGFRKRRKFREMSKEEIQEEMKQYALQNAKIDDEGEEEVEKTKKKRRRQKKGKKAATPSEKITTPETSTNTEVGEKSKETNETESEDKAKSKRTRKKKGKKGTKADMAEVNDETNNLTTTTKENNGKSEKSNSKKSRKRDRKSKKKDHKEKVDGISASRLQSYGL